MFILQALDDMYDASSNKLKMHITVAEHVISDNQISYQSFAPGIKLFILAIEMITS